MTAVRALFLRNLRLFVRDPAAVFFSILSALILLALYVLFLGNLQVDTLSSTIPQADEADIRSFVDAWVFAGTTMITTLTTGLAALAVFVDDRASGRFHDFLVSPVRRWHLVLGYMASSFVIAVVMSTIVLAVGQVYMLIRQEAAMDGADWLAALGAVALSAAAFSAISSFIVTFLASSGAFSAVSTVVGTLIGFVAGAYLPPGLLPTGVVNVMNVLPFAQSALLLRGPIAATAAETLAGGSPDALESLNAFYGMTLQVGDVDITPGLAAAELAAVVLVFTLLGILRIRSRIR